MQKISLPTSYNYTELDKQSGKVEILGCYPGYGTTLGNALRRVLLSSLSGAAITSVKIKGVSHEFSTIPGVMEDVVQIILNLKKVRFKHHSEESVKVYLKAKGEGEVTAKNIKCPSSVEVVTPDQIVATITDKKADLEIEMEIGSGLGYIPVEQQIREDKEIGVIAIDAIYTPIRRVNFQVENMRVGKRTDYNKITIEIVTDGSIAPDEAFNKSIDILVSQFSAISSLAKGEAEVEEEEVRDEIDQPKEDKVEAKEEVADVLVVPVSELKLSTRTINVLETNKVKKVRDIVKLTEEKLRNLEGMGDKGVKEIRKAIGEFGLTLK